MKSAILAALASGPASGGQIAEQLGLSAPSVYARLCELRRDGAVIGTRTRPVVFRLAVPVDDEPESTVATAVRTQPNSVFALGGSACSR